MVVAIPFPVVIQGHHKEILAFQDFDDLRRVRRSDNGVAQGGAEPGQYGGPGEEPADLGRLPAQYLFGQEVDNEPVAAGEVTHEFGGRRVRLQGERSEVYPRRPPIGPGHQVGGIGRAEGRRGCWRRQRRPAMMSPWE